MKKFAFLVPITAVVTYAQMPASRKLKSDAERIASALQAGPKLLRETRPCSTSLLRPAASSGFSKGEEQFDTAIFIVGEGKHMQNYKSAGQRNQALARKFGIS